MCDMGEIVEYKLTRLRANDILKSLKGKKIPLSLEYMKHIHEQLFKDVPSLEDANGVVRQGSLRKGDSYFCPLEQIKEKAKDIFSELKKDKLYRKPQSVDRHELVNKLAYYHSKINYIHPFYEGNGRTQNIIITHLANETGFNLDLGKVSKVDFNKASQMANIPLQLGSNEPENTMRLIFDKALSDERIQEKSKTTPKPDKPTEKQQSPNEKDLEL